MVNVWDPWHTIFFRSTMGSCEIDAWRTWNRSGPAVERRLFLNAMRFLRSKQMKMCLRLMLIIIIIIIIISSHVDVQQSQSLLTSTVLHSSMPRLSLMSDCVELGLVDTLPR